MAVEAYQTAWSQFHEKSRTEAVHPSHDEVPGVRSKRGFIFAMIGDLSSSLGFAFGALVPLLLLLCSTSRSGIMRLSGALLWR